MDTEAAATDGTVVDITERQPLWSPSYDQMRAITFHVLANWIHNHPEIARKDNLHLNAIAQDEAQDANLRDQAAACLLIRQGWLATLVDPSPEYPQDKIFDLSWLSDDDVLFYLINSKDLPFEPQFTQLVAKRGIQLGFDNQDPSVPTDLPTRISYQDMDMPPKKRPKPGYLKPVK